MSTQVFSGTAKELAELTRRFRVPAAPWWPKCCPQWDPSTYGGMWIKGWETAHGGSEPIEADLDVVASIIFAAAMVWLAEHKHAPVFRTFDVGNPWAVLVRVDECGGPSPLHAVLAAVEGK